MQPLLTLAPRWRRVGVTALGVAGAGLVLSLTGWGLPGLVAWGAAAALGTLAMASGGLAALRHRRAGGDAQAVLALFADDPDAILVTDPSGATLGRNAATGARTSVDDWLRDWCADPGGVAEGLLALGQAARGGARVFHRSDRALRVTVQRAVANPDLVIWRFAMLEGLHPRGADSLALPLITVAVEGPIPNAAARALFGPALPGPEVLLAGQPVAAPDGRLFHPHPLGGPEGASDVLLLPRPLGDPDEGHRPLDFEELPVALVHLDRAGHIVGTNRLARGLLGLSSTAAYDFWEVVEGLGRPVSDWLDDARDGRALGRPEVLRATLTGQETFVQIILRRAGGLGGDGGLVAVISDATELKSLEARFVQSQKMQAIGQLAGGVAHDFNNLLTAISGHCDLLLLNRDRFDPDYNDLLQIHQNANRAAALVRQLLAFSRKQTLKPETFRLESLLEDLTHLLTRLVGERIALALTHDPEIGAIRADRRQLEQVIMNLVVNARDAMPMGGTIKITTEMRHLTAEMEHGRARVPVGDYAVIHVKDEGVGIAADIIDKIFEPFFTTKKLGEGTGLGLSTAYGIVKQMGGYIFCDSIEGTGTTFSIYFANHAASEVPLPVSHPESHPESQLAPADRQSDDPGAGDRITAEHVPSPPPSAAKAQEPPLPAAGPLRQGAILLVEDEAPVRAFAARALRLQGYQVFEAQDGEEALEFLNDGAVRVDLFVTDVIMPGIDGPGWVSKALEARPGTPVVFVSGYTEDTLSAALGRIPGAVFLGKPFSLSDLSETIARQLV